MRVQMDIDLPKKLAIPAVLGIILYFLMLQMQGLSLEPNVSAQYMTFYTNLAILDISGLVLCLVLMLYSQLKIGEILELETKAKAAIFGIFVILILVMTLGAGQIIPVPRASIGENLQLTPGTEFITSAIIPGFLEDTAYLILLPMFLLAVFMLIGEHVFDFEWERNSLLVLMILVALISSTGYNIWVIPGFTSAHVPAYGEQQGAYFGAWIFSFGQTMVYEVTGWLAPVAHILHNGVIVASQLYGFAIGQFTILGV